jgi:hypothetical protein
LLSKDFKQSGGILVNEEEICQFMSTALVSPNRYDLRGRNVTVFYGEAGLDGKPYFSYVSADLSLTFKGDQIRILKTDLGKLVSVGIRMTIDAGSTSFSILVPRVLMPKGAATTPIKTVGITTIHKFSVIPMFSTGQNDFYTTVALSGTARVEII